jgi:ABC-2 type transport system permease protein
VKALAIARRELASYFLTPLGYAVATLFLLVEGYSFWLFMALLNGQGAPHGAVLQYFFGGTFLYWLFLMFLVAVVTMRLVAEERRTGTIEPLLTAPVGAWDVVLGKFLGALAFYAALFAPTLLYVLLLRAYAPAGAAPDPGPIAAGYLGTLLVGAGAIALGLAASSVTRHQIVAALVTFVGLTLMLLVGAMGDALVRSGPIAPVLQYVNLFRHMDDFGRGIVDSRRVVYHLGLIALGLFASVRALDRTPRRRVAVELLLLLAVVVGVNVLSARHYLRGDWTRGRTFALSGKTEQLLRSLDKPVDVIVFMLPSGEGANDLFGDVRELLERARRLTPNLRVEYVDIDREPERLRVVGKKYGVQGDDLVNGVIVVADPSSGQSKFITRDELADYSYDSESRGRQLKAWKGEQALDAALLAVTEEKSPLLCFTQGHGEPSLDSMEPGEYGDFVEELKRDHDRVRALDLSQKGVNEVPRDCDLVVVAGPEQPFTDEETRPLQQYLERGGKLLAMIGPTLDEKVTRWVPTGLETLLERWGADLRNDLVVDEPRLRASVIAFGVTEGYADHPITSHLMHHRTVWSDVREVRPVPKPGLTAKALVTTSDASWGETDLGVYHATAELRYDKDKDVKGPLPIAVAVERTEGTGKGARLVVIGSSAIASNRQVLGYDRDFLLSSVAWLLHAEPKIAVGPRTPEHLRLELDESQLSRVLWVCVLGLPLFVLLLGLGVFWVRRG